MLSDEAKKGGKKKGKKQGWINVSHCAFLHCAFLHCAFLHSAFPHSAEKEGGLDKCGPLHAQWGATRLHLSL